jgi:hypothetical protein
MNAKVISVYNDLFAVKMYHIFFIQYPYKLPLAYQLSVATKSCALTAGVSLSTNTLEESRANRFIDPLIIASSGRDLFIYF